MEKVSVIMPAYNAASFIRDAVESAIRQTYPNIEIIVVDDGSTDATADVLREYGSRGLIRYFHQENSGCGSAKNTGFLHAAGEYIAYLDADDIWYETKVERQLACLKANPDAAIVFCDEYRIFEEGEPVKAPPKLKPGEDAYEKLLTECYTTPSTIMLKREVIDSIGPYNVKMAYNEDWEFLLKAGLRYKIAYLPEYLLTRKLHPGSMTSRHYYNAYYFLEVCRSLKGLLDKRRESVLKEYNVKRCWKSVAWLIDRKHFMDGIKLCIQVVRRHPPFVLKLPGLFRRGLGALIKG
jgi:glycosyltransferase involved in cell wall biosynthesis